MARGAPAGKSPAPGGLKPFPGQAVNTTSGTALREPASGAAGVSSYLQAIRSETREKYNIQPCRFTVVCLMSFVIETRVAGRLARQGWLMPAAEALFNPFGVESCDGRRDPRGSRPGLFCSTPSGSAEPLVTAEGHPRAQGTEQHANNHPGGVGQASPGCKPRVCGFAHDLKPERVEQGHDRTCRTVIDNHNLIIHSAA